jgi:hypothetical protein
MERQEHIHSKKKMDLGECGKKYFLWDGKDL